MTDRPVDGDGHRVAAVVLAAGEATRFGSLKQLASFRGRSLLEHVMTRAAEAGLSPVVAVVPPQLPLPAPAPGIALVRVPNSEPKLGMSHSLRLGLAAVPSAADAALILLGDQPTVPLTTIAAVLAARGRRPLVATRAAGRLAPPVLIERSHFHLADAAAGDVGLREILAARRDEVATVEVAAHVPDVDTPADLAALVEDPAATHE